MAAKKISHLPSATQALVRYISQEANSTSLDNMLLQRLNDISLLGEDLARIQDRLARARAEQLFIDFMLTCKTPRPLRSDPAKQRGVSGEETQAVTEGMELGAFFHSREEAQAIRRQQTVSQRNLWTAYYARYGCLICETKDHLHQSSGLCAGCHARTVARREGLLDGKRKWGAFGRVEHLVPAPR